MSKCSYVNALDIFECECVCIPETHFAKCLWAWWSDLVCLWIMKPHVFFFCSGLKERLFSQMTVSCSECGMLMQVCVCVCQWVNGMFTIEGICICIISAGTSHKFPCTPFLFWIVLNYLHVSLLSDWMQIMSAFIVKGFMHIFWKICEWLS